MRNKLKPLLQKVILTFCRCLILAISILVSSNSFGQSLDDQLLNACKSNKLAVALVSLNAGANPNSADENGASALMWAMYKSDLGVAKMLVDKGAKANTDGVIYLDSLRNTYYGSLTAIAAGEGNLEKLKYLIEELNLPVGYREFNPESKKEDGWTAIRWAWNNNEVSCFNYLGNIGGNLEKDVELELESAKIHYGNDSPAYWFSLSEMADVHVYYQKFDTAIAEYLDLLELTSDISSAYLDFLKIPFLNAGGVCFTMHDFSRAKAFIQRALEIEHASPFSTMADQEYSLNLLCYALQESGEFNESLDCYQQVLTLRQQLYGSDHAEYLNGLNNVALQYSHLGDYENSKNIYAELSSAIINLLGKDSDFNIVVQKNYAWTLRKTGDYQESERLFKELLEIVEAQYGTSNANFADILSNLGSLYSEKGLYEKAFKYHLQALESVDTTMASGLTLYPDIANNLALDYQNLGQLSKAEKVFKTALSLNVRLKGKNHPSLSTIHLNLAGIYKDQASFNNAINSCQKAFQIIESTMGIDQPEFANALEVMGGIHSDMGEFTKAEKENLAALRIRESVFGDTSIKTLQSYNNLGSLYAKSGQLSKGLGFMEKAVSVSEILLGPDHPTCAIYLNNLGGIYRDLENFKKAEELYRHAMQIRRSALPANHPDIAVSMNSLAGLYSDIGLINKSEQFYKEAIAIQTQAFGENHPVVATSLSNLALLYQSNDYYDWVEALYDRILNIKNAVYGKDHPQTVITLGNLGQFYVHIGDYEKAEEIQRKAMSIRGTANNTSRSDGFQENNLGLILWKQGKTAEAESLYKSALANSTQFQETNCRNCLTVIENLGLLYRKAQRSNQGFLEYSKLFKLQVNTFATDFSFLSEHEKEKYSNKYFHRFNGISSFIWDWHHQHQLRDGLGYDQELVSKGLILNSGLRMRNRLASYGPSPSLNLFNQWQALKKIVLQKSLSSNINYQFDIDSINVNAENIEKQLTRLSHTFAKSQMLGKAKWSDVKSQLSDKNVAIEFSSFPYCRTDGTRSDSTMYVALVLRNDYECPIMVKLCEERQLNSLFHSTDGSEKDVIANLYRGAVRVGENNKFSYGKRLYELLWKPLDSLLNEGDKIYFAPSGLMHRIALSAIPYDDKGTLLSDRYTLARLSTTAKLLDKEGEQTKPKEIALFGGIEYEWKETAKVDSELSENFVSRALPFDLDRGNTSWTYLPGTLKETESIASIASSKKINVKTYTGTEATEEQIKSLGGKNSPTVLHIASHGFFFPDPQRDHERDRMMQMMGDREQVYRYSDDPLNRAGLLFSGANHRWQDGEVPDGKEDGILTANEATYIPLTNTELVVLSACETGLGEVKGSEGVFGLQRAFKAAGAEYVMMSLWKVPDQETAEFMESFYGQYLSNHTIPDSYHHAQRTMRDKYPNDPYKWAGFVLMR